MGEAPSRLTAGLAPFSGRSGRALERLLGIPGGTLGRVFDAMNLLDEWPGPAGKGSRPPSVDRRAVWPRIDARASSDRVVLAGKRVAAALGLSFFEYFRPGPVVSVACRRTFVVTVVPHPSGVNRWWNDPANRARASRYLRRLVGVSLLAEARRNGQEEDQERARDPQRQVRARRGVAPEEPPEERAAR